MHITNNFTKPQKAAISHIRSDLRLLYTVLMNRTSISSNYQIMLFPLTATIIDGTEDWIKSYNNSHPQKIEMPLFKPEEERFYELARNAIKLWDMNYHELRNLLAAKYSESDEYFSGLCEPLAKQLKLYNIYGADIANGKYCGNTILCNSYIPKLKLGEVDGERLKNMAVIGGRYIRLFDAMDQYPVDTEIRFFAVDYGGYINSPVGNDFSDRFVLFSILCQINFVLVCVGEYIIEECPAKLRFAYLLYYYLCKLLPEINCELGTTFSLSESYISDLFRNSMAHYRIGVALKPDEIVEDDIFFGLTNKYLHCDYWSLKANIIHELTSLEKQISIYLQLEEVQ